MFFSSKLKVCQVSAKSKSRFFYLEFLNKLVGHHEKKPKNPKFSTSKSIFKPIRKFSRLTPNIKKLTLRVLLISQVSAKSENLFFSSFIHSSLPLASLAAVRGGASQLGAHGFSTVRARLARMGFSKVRARLTAQGTSLFSGQFIKEIPL